MKTLLLLTCLAFTACQSSRGLIIYENGLPKIHAYETAQLPYVPGEFGAGMQDGQTSATMVIEHGILGGVALAGIGAIAGAGVASGGLLP